MSGRHAGIEMSCLLSLGGCAQEIWACSRVVSRRVCSAVCAGFRVGACGRVACRREGLGSARVAFKVQIMNSAKDGQANTEAEIEFPL